MPVTLHPTIVTPCKLYTAPPPVTGDSSASGTLLLAKRHAVNSQAEQPIAPPYARMVTGYAGIGPATELPINTVSRATTVSSDATAPPPSVVVPAPR